VCRERHGHKGRAARGIARTSSISQHGGRGDRRQETRRESRRQGRTPGSGGAFARHLAASVSFRFSSGPGAGRERKNGYTRGRAWWKLQVRKWSRSMVTTMMAAPVTGARVNAPHLSSRTVPFRVGRAYEDEDRWPGQDVDAGDDDDLRGASLLCCEWRLWFCACVA
jgi:hypothetical protein